MRTRDVRDLDPREQALLGELLEAGRSELPTQEQLQRVWYKAEPWAAHKPPLFLLDRDGLPVPTRSGRLITETERLAPAVLPHEDAVEARCSQAPAPPVRTLEWGWFGAIAVGVLVLLTFSRSASQIRPAERPSTVEHSVAPQSGPAARWQPAQVQPRSPSAATDTAKVKEERTSSSPSTAVRLVRTTPPIWESAATKEHAVTSLDSVSITRADTARAVLKSPAKVTTTQGAAKDEPPAASGKQPSALELLKSAQDHLRSDPRQSLALLAEYERRFGSGALTQEREVLAIDAMLRLGQRERARTRAAEFRKRFPGSSHVRRINVMLKRP